MYNIIQFKSALSNPDVYDLSKTPVISNVLYNSKPQIISPTDKINQGMLNLRISRLESIISHIKDLKERIKKFEMFCEKIHKPPTINLPQNTSKQCPYKQNPQK